MKRTLVLTLICTLSCASSSLRAGGTSYWTHTNEADFKEGRFHNVVATNLGDVKLSRAVKTLLEQDPRVTTVYALVEAPDGTVYAGTGPQGIVLQLTGEKISTYLTLEDQNVFSLLVDKEGRLLMGTGGEKGRILRLDKPGEKPTELFTEEGVQYIWQMRQLPDGTIYAATGPNGQIFQINADGTHSVLFKSDENNILSLVTDGKDTLYAGTDPNALVYRINRQSKDVFVLFDAPESEIRSLVLDAKGNLYAGTAQAGEGEENGPGEPGTAEKTGRPEGGEAVTPLPSPAPKEPEPPAVPKPNPGEPDPIPKAKPKLLVLDPALVADFDDTAEAPTTRDHRAAPTPGPGPAPGPGGPPFVGQRNMPGRPGVKGQMPPGLFGAPPAETNAIYKIDADGFVTEVFRNPAMILSLIENNGVLLAGTGSEGLVYQVNPAADETVELAKVDPKQVMSLLATKDGRMILGLANVGGLASMTSGYATEGTFTSPVLDAAQISRFGKVHLVGSLPAGSTLTLATRSGNLEEAGDTGWSKWSTEIPAAEYAQITSSPARFLQYRLTMTSTEGKSTPVVDEVDVAYRMPNLPPQVKSVKITAMPEADSARPPVMMMMPPGVVTGAPAPKDRLSGRNRMLTWETSDPNTDSLEYSIHFRAGTQGPWILLQDKIKEPQFLWDTRGVPDGRYQLRVTASDVRSNPPGEGKSAGRVSDPVIVDNTPPVIGDLKTSVAAQSVKIEAKLVDRTSSVASFEYSLDSKDDWQTASALDSIFDSPEEAVSFSVDGLSSGAHEIMLRAADDHGNQAYEAVHVTIAAPGK